jgi:hypothetical protein
MSAGERSENDDRAEGEARRLEQITLGGSYLGQSVEELRASGSSDRLFEVLPASEEGRANVIRGPIGRRLALARQRECTRSAVLFAILAAEAYANQYLQWHLTGEEFKAADKLPTLDKYLLGPRLVRGDSLLERGSEPAQTLKELLSKRSALVHPKLQAHGKGSQGNEAGVTPYDAARYIVAVADAAGWLLANSANAESGKMFDMTVVTVDMERKIFLSYGKAATERLPEPTDDPVPDLMGEAWGRWLDLPNDA